MDGSSVTCEAHHAAPRCLISLHEKANGTSLDGEGIQAWLEWEWEAMRWCVPVEISREDLDALVDQSTVVLEREKHRLIHENDWRRWGARGGRETLRRYGPRWFSLLARKRWGRIGGARGCKGAPVRPVWRGGGGLEVTGPNVAPKPPWIAFKVRRGR
jgi:hypothetical protein